MLEPMNRWWGDRHRIDGSTLSLPILCITLSSGEPEDRLRTLYKTNEKILANLPRTSSILFSWSTAEHGDHQSTFISDDMPESRLTIAVAQQTSGETIEEAVLCAYSFPLNNGFPSISSAAIQPTAQISTVDC